VKLVAEKGVHPYYDVVDYAPKHASGVRVIRAAYCTKDEAELFAASFDMRARLKEIEPLYNTKIVQFAVRIHKNVEKVKRWLKQKL
jgi:hypothetical protein